MLMGEARSISSATDWIDGTRRIQSATVILNVKIHVTAITFRRRNSSWRHRNDLR
jgi:hypothetical protein